MIVDCNLKNLLKLIGKKLTVQELEDNLFLMKAEVENVEGDEIQIEVNPDRQDMLSVEGIARALRAFIGVSSGFREYSVKKSGKNIMVKPGLKNIRPFISCGILRNAKITDELIKDYMHLQESLTSTHGRNRKKASIGLYVNELIEFPVIYRTQVPQKIRFVPLEYEDEMDGYTILEKHGKGILFGSIIQNYRKWPLLLDTKGQILSLPPIINSNNLGRVTPETKDIFVEVTGTHKPTVDQALNIIITALAEHGGNIESVTINYPDGLSYETPNLNPTFMDIEIERVWKLLGIELESSEIITALERMCYGVKMKRKGIVNVHIPQYRTDIMHPVDIIEDIAIGFGFDKLKPRIPQTMTSGKLLPVSRLKNKVRDLMVGVEYQEIMSYVMSSPEIMKSKMLRNRSVTETGNPKSRDYSVLRNSLMPILLDFIARNQHADYPQRIFEVGDIVIPDEKMETMTLQIPSVSGLVSDMKVNITDLMIEIGFILRGMGLDNRFQFKKREDETFIKGRAGDILVDGYPCGMFGEISPQVLENFQIGAPVVAFEIFLPKSGVW
jgi:phenylalanyl-tRNA synthetase beta chain